MNYRLVQTIGFDKTPGSEKTTAVPSFTRRDMTRWKSKRSGSQRKARLGTRIDDKILEGFLTRETSHFIAGEVKALTGTMRITVEELVEHLLPWVSSRAIVAMSKFKVGAICRGVSGNLYFGVNIEFPGQPLNTTIHAEQCAFANAYAKGETGLRAVYITAAPCGHCRQFLNEINTANELQIQLPGKPPLSLQDLLPESFGPTDLEIESQLMTPQSHQIIAEIDPNDSLEQESLEAASQAYAPYSKAIAGIALRTSNQQVFKGPYVECAAYNPSLPPLQVALSNLVMAGRNFNEIADVVLTVTNDSSVDHIENTRSLLKTISDIPLRVVKARLKV